MFTTAGLLIAPGIAGQIQRFQQITNARGDELHLLAYERHALTMPRDAAVPEVKDIIRAEEGKPVLPVYVLTDVGLAVASILADRQDAAFSNLVLKLKSVMPSVKITEYRKHGSNFVTVAVH
jgi:hypothetical protein